MGTPHGSAVTVGGRTPEVSKAGGAGCVTPPCCHANRPGNLCCLYLIQRGWQIRACHGPEMLLYGALLAPPPELLHCQSVNDAADGSCAAGNITKNCSTHTHTAHLNHHVRNALQLILNRAELDTPGLRELTDIQDAVDGIDWALREILPRATAPISTENPFVTSRPPAPAPRPYSGKCPLYLQETNTFGKGTPGASPAGGDQPVQTSVSRNKRA